jgi:hypothetical protein
MIQTIKFLGAALIAVMAMGGVVASAASAAEHHFSGTSGDSVTATALAPYVYEHTTGSGKNNGCKKVTMEGKVEGTQTALTLTPVFSECVVEENGEPQFSMLFEQNGCHFIFTGVTTTGNPTGGEHANLRLECPVGQSIKTKMTAFKLLCSSIGPQLFQHAVRYENVTAEGKEHIRASITAHGGSSTTEGSCGEGTHNNSLITTELTLSAKHGVSITTT